MSHCNEVSSIHFVSHNVQTEFIPLGGTLSENPHWKQFLISLFVSLWEIKALKFLFDYEQPIKLKYEHILVVI